VRAPGGGDAERKAAGSGGGDEDEDVAARALQRALVQRGALLLPEWAFELAPAMTYGHTGEDSSVTVPGADGSPSTTVAVRRRTHQMIGQLTARLGLPWELQVETAVPFLLAWNDASLAGAVRNDASGWGIGDPRLSLTRQLLRAHRLVPDLLLTGTWKPPLGSSPFDAPAGKVGLGSGYTSIGGTLTASKASDPLVFLASLSYTANLPTGTSAGRRDTGDTFGLGAGAILAVSPETSLSFLLDFHYRPEDHLGGRTLIGTDETFAVLQVGLATVITRRVLLNFTLGIGLTPDSPSVQLGISVPVRF
jgi:hypothetical protein